MSFSASVCGGGGGGGGGGQRERRGGGGGGAAGCCEGVCPSHPHLHSCTKSPSREVNIFFKVTTIIYFESDILLQAVIIKLIISLHKQQFMGTVHSKYVNIACNMYIQRHAISEPI